MSIPLPTTPEQRIAALEQVRAHASLLLDRLTAMGQSGALSEVAADGMTEWVARLAASLKAVPPNASTAQE